MILETEHLLLREFAESDWQRVLEYQSDSLYLRYYAWADRTEAEVRDFVGMFISWRREEPRTKFQLAAVLKENDLLIGNCGIRMDDSERHQADIGYEFDSCYWNRGYAPEAARAILTFGFEELGVVRIHARCIADNVGSIRVLEKIGMHLEHRKPEKEYIKGRWCDSLVFSVLDRQWREQREERDL